jgi:hypothetical protein
MRNSIKILSIALLLSVPLLRADDAATEATRVFTDEEAAEFEETRIAAVGFLEAAKTPEDSDTMTEWDAQRAMGEHLINLLAKKLVGVSAKELEVLGKIFLKNELMKAETRAAQEALIAGMTLEGIASYAEANDGELKKAANPTDEKTADDAGKELETANAKPVEATADSTDGEEAK